MPTQWNPELGFAIGDNICLRIGATLKYYNISNRDTIFLQETPGEIAADSTDSYSEVTNLNPPHGQLYSIYKIWVDGNIKLYCKQPAATNRFGTQRSPAGGFLTDHISGMKGGMYLNLNFTIDNPPSIQLVNEQNIAITPKIWYIGWRYAIEELPSKPTQFTQITISGIAQ